MSRSFPKSSRRAHAPKNRAISKGPTASKKNKPLAPSRKGSAKKSVRAGTTAVNGSGSEKTLQAWAADYIFGETKTATWTGLVDPLEAVELYPSNLPFIKALACERDQKKWRWLEAVHPLDSKRVARFFGSINQSKESPHAIDYRMVDKSGGAVWIRHTLISKSRSGKQVLWRGFVSDIQTEKSYQLENLAVSEREQNRIGQDLHDDLCQVLAGLSCLMKVFEARMVDKIPDEIPTLKEINLQLVDAMHRTRALTHGLFPGKVQIADVRGALLELTSQIRARFNVDIKTHFSGRFQKHKPDQIIQIYRLAQEAIGNAVKHAQSTVIDLKLEALPDGMLLSVIDNGGGLSNVDTANSGIGLHVMRYRAGILGGEFSIRNGPVKGAVVTLRYPYT